MGSCKYCLPPTAVTNFVVVVVDIAIIFIVVLAIRLGIAANSVGSRSQTLREAAGKHCTQLQSRRCRGCSEGNSRLRKWSEPALRAVLLA